MYMYIYIYRARPDLGLRRTPTAKAPSGTSQAKQFQNKNPKFKKVKQSPIWVSQYRCNVQCGKRARTSETAAGRCL
jgi:hypothetical protein